MKNTTKKSAHLLSRNLLSTAAVIALMWASAFAAAPAWGYLPGATLDPDCAPSDTDCIVQNVWTESDPLRKFVEGSGSLNAVYTGWNVWIGVSDPQYRIDLWGDQYIDTKVHSLWTYTSLWQELSWAATVLWDNVIPSAALNKMQIQTTHGWYWARAIRMRYHATPWIEFHAIWWTVTKWDDFDSPRMFISNNGRVWVGTTGPGAQFQITTDGLSGDALRITDGTNNDITVNQDGNIGVWNTASKTDLLRLYRKTSTNPITGWYVHNTSLESVLDSEIDISWSLPFEVLTYDKSNTKQTYMRNLNSRILRTGTWQLSYQRWMYNYIYNQAWSKNTDRTVWIENTIDNRSTINAEITNPYIYSQYNTATHNWIETLSNLWGITNIVGSTVTSWWVDGTTRGIHTKATDNSSVNSTYVIGNQIEAVKNWSWKVTNLYGTYNYVLSWNTPTTWWANVLKGIYNLINYRSQTPWETTSSARWIDNSFTYASTNPSTYIEGIKTNTNVTWWTPTTAAWISSSFKHNGTGTGTTSNVRWIENTVTINTSTALVKNGRNIDWIITNNAKIDNWYLQWIRMRVTDSSVLWWESYEQSALNVSNTTSTTNDTEIKYARWWIISQNIATTAWVKTESTWLTVDNYMRTTSTNTLPLNQWLDVYNYIYPTHTQPITNNYWWYIKNYVWTIAPVTNSYGLRVGSSVPATANVTNNYGLYVDALANGITKNYSIYSAWWDSYFKWNVGINNLNPVSKLAVTGLPKWTDDSVADGTLQGAVCITTTWNMYIDTDWSCAN